MRFRTHSELAGFHATHLSPSKPHWINYSDDKFDRVVTSAMASARGDRLHKIAADLIRERIKLPEDPVTLNMYVNDSIGWRMTPEVPLVYSFNAFGTADAIAFRREKLRVSDLKTGVTPTKVQQLECYAALFCLEYKENPFEIEIELRIYQNDEVREYTGDPDTIFQIMERYKARSQRVDELREEYDA